jgi:hypothetical protein
MRQKGIALVRDPNDGTQEVIQLSAARTKLMLVMMLHGQ